jgi:two-component system, LytTR family, response regulator
MNIVAFTPIRAAIVEDEPLARETLRDFVAETTWITLVGEASNGAEAVRMLLAARPDLVFLDVRMPELSGLEVLERIDYEPAVIFTTAYDDYAVQAFELGAVDYLLKPFGRARFHKTLDRIAARPVAYGDARASVADRLAAAAHEPLSVLFVRHAGRIVPVPVDEITRVEAADDYATVHAGGRRYLVGLTLNDLERRLPAERFRRVHRSHIVNLGFVVAFEPYDRRLLVRMRDGATVLASRSASQALRGLAR